MAFCSGCGAQMSSDERFCVKCGADQKAQAAGTPAVPVAAPQAAIPPSVQRPMGLPPQYPPQPPAQPFAGMPPQYPPQPPVQPFAGMPPQFPPPIVMGMPPGAQPASKNPVVWLIVAAVIFGFWYIGTHDKDNTTPGTAPTTQTQPGPGGGGGGGGGGNTQALVAAQQFLNPSYNAVNGQVQVSQAQWLNGSNTAIATAGLGCEQEDANGQGLAQDQVTLTGPAAPGQTLSVPTFQIGAVAQGAAKVNCKITAVTPAN
jgi:hypothetical protein